MIFGEFKIAEIIQPRIADVPLKLKQDACIFRKKKMLYCLIMLPVSYSSCYESYHILVMSLNITTRRIFVFRCEGVCLLHLSQRCLIRVQIGVKRTAQLGCFRGVANVHSYPVAEVVAESPILKLEITSIRLSSVYL